MVSQGNEALSWRYGERM